MVNTHIKTFVWSAILVTVSAAPHEACLWRRTLLHANHTACNINRSPDFKQHIFVAKQDILKNHNTCRQQVKPFPRRPLLDLTYDVDLARLAQNLVIQCSYTPDTINQRSVPGKWNYVGQNMAYQKMYVMSTASVVDAWCKEQDNWQYGVGATSPLHDVGHFTQIVWENTTSVGCAAGLCGEARTSNSSYRPVIYVCNYGPAGNIGSLGTAFRQPYGIADPGDGELVDADAQESKSGTRNTTIKTLHSTAIPPAKTWLLVEQKSTNKTNHNTDTKNTATSLSPASMLDAFVTPKVVAQNVGEVSLATTNNPGQIDVTSSSKSTERSDIKTGINVNLINPNEQTVVSVINTRTTAGVRPQRVTKIAIQNAKSSDLQDSHNNVLPNKIPHKEDADITVSTRSHRSGFTTNPKVRPNNVSFAEMKVATTGLAEPTTPNSRVSLTGEHIPTHSRVSTEQSTPTSPDVPTTLALTANQAAQANNRGRLNSMSDILQVVLLTVYVLG